ncbi:hypothetical protein TL16_g02743 [Triparma laevis f. inornata]|uniref:Uncharacterized protein n=1 Tax=Triparma laevis f. inornata TaxID=1714386 RepID=A0A9W6ZQQ8_9STRA|nr:hypothetical protein TL16_g02743 [Triparma laevis f. inornata]
MSPSRFPTSCQAIPQSASADPQPYGGAYGNNNYNYPVTVAQPGENVTVDHFLPNPGMPNGASVCAWYNDEPFAAVVLRYSRAHGKHGVKFGDGARCFMPVDTDTAKELRGGTKQRAGS